MDDLLSAVDEKCAEATVSPARVICNQITLTSTANMDDFLSRWKTLNFSRERIRNSV